MSLYRGAGGSGDATADSSSEALLIRELAVEVQADADAAAASATSASGSATSASTSATNAATSATNAASSATSASNSASAASTSASNAATSATAAQTAQTAAELAETNAETAETNAAASASSASSSATTATTQATNASSSASAAATSATNASNSASAAATSATNAASSATSASGSATAAASSASSASTSATNAAASETSAASSATTATTQAGIATTQATNAASSASAAATSATNAAASETAAASSATSAASSASTATTQATNASNSASAAATSATNAANSATLAASYTPSQTGNSGKYLTTDGTNTSWDALATVANSGSYNDLSDKPTLTTNLDGLTDVAITSPATDQVLKYNGSGWVNGAAPDNGSLNPLSVIFRNRLIDAGFIINQRVYVSNTALSAGTYAHDRWKAGASGCTYTFTQGSAGVPITITITAGSLQQVIEGCNMPEGGTYVLSWEGTAQARFNGGTYGSSPLAVTGITAGANTTIEFNTGTLLKPQLEVGSSATGYEYRQYGQELALCQRYYQTSYPYGTAIQAATGVTDGASFVSINTSDSINGGLLPVTMRATPTFAVYSTLGGVGSPSARDNSAGTSTTGITLNGGTTTNLPRLSKTAGLPVTGSSCSAQYTASAEL